MLSHKSSHSGFTLLELLIVVLILGMVSVIVSPSLGALAGSRESGLRSHNEMNNRLVKASLEQYAKTFSATGTLPSPATVTGVGANAVDTTNANLLQTVLQAGVIGQEINKDGTSAGNRRIYQLVTGQTENDPFWYQTGPLVTLTYEIGVVYATRCAAEGTCANTPPGASGALNAGNVGTWTTSGTDYGAVMVSSLPLQKQMLGLSAQRVDRIRDALTAYFRGLQASAPAESTTNWLPGAGMGGKDPAVAANQGCRDGWYDLSTTTVLPTIGLSQTELGITGWGGHVEYCRVYDPTAGLSEAAPPYYAALRIRKSVSLGQNPDNTASAPANNVVFTL